MKYSQKQQFWRNLCVGFTFLSMTAGAQEVISPWRTQAEFGFLSSNGNSESRSTNARLSATYDLEQWKYQSTLIGLSSAASNPDIIGSPRQTSAERYGIDLQADRKIEDENSFFGKLNYDDDRFSGFDYESGVVLGYGHQVLQSEPRNFRIEIGPGFRIAQPVVGAREEEAFISTTFLFDQALGQTSRFAQSLTIDIGDQRSVSTSVTSVSAQIVGQLAMKFALTMKHNSDPAFDIVGNEKASVDKETSVNLVYSF